MKTIKSITLEVGFILSCLISNAQDLPSFVPVELEKEAALHPKVRDIDRQNYKVYYFTTIPIWEQLKNFCNHQLDV